MTGIEIESAKDPSFNATVARLASAGIDLDTAVLKMGYIRTSSPLLGDIRAAAVIAIDDTGRVAEVVHMPLANLDPVTLDRAIIEPILEAAFLASGSIHEYPTERVAQEIIAAVRAGTTPKEN
jgi:hypothetical protein